MHNYEVDLISDHLNEKNTGRNILLFVNAILECKQYVIHSTGNREVFACAVPENHTNYMLVVDKKEQKVHVFSEPRYAFKDKEPIFLSERKNMNKPVEQIYGANRLFSINLVRQEQPSEWVELLKGCDKIKELAKEWQIEETEIVEAGHIRNSTQNLSRLFLFLHSVCLLTDKNHEKLASLYTSFLAINQKIAQKEFTEEGLETHCRLDFLLQFAQNKNWKKINSFTYNDHDNHLWSPFNNVLCLGTQNYTIFAIKDNNYWEIYYYCEDTPIKNEKTLLSALQNQTLDYLTNLLATVYEKRYTFTNASLTNALIDDLNYATEEIVKRFKQYPDYGIDTHSYEYQKNYYYNKSGLTEIEFLAQVFMTAGSGFELTHKGLLVDYNIGVIDNLEPEEFDPEDRLEEVSYCNASMIKIIKKSGLLAPVWYDGLKKLIFYLERDKPQVIVQDMPLIKWLHEAHALLLLLDKCSE